MGTRQLTLRYAVVGATGGQGGAVTAALRDAEALLRGITRRLESLRAQELTRSGVDVVAAGVEARELPPEDRE